MDQLNNLKGMVESKIGAQSRRARTRSLIQLGGLIDAVGLTQSFDIELGRDLQKDISLKKPIAALTGALLLLKDIIENDETSYALLVEQGLRFLAHQSLHNSHIHLESHEG